MELAVSIFEMAFAPSLAYSFVSAAEVLDCEVDMVVVAVRPVMPVEFLVAAFPVVFSRTTYYKELALWAESNLDRINQILPLAIEERGHFQPDPLVKQKGSATATCFYPFPNVI